MTAQTWTMMVVLLSSSEIEAEDQPVAKQRQQAPRIEQASAMHRPDIPFELRSLDAEQAGELLGYKATYVRDHLACRPDFPKRVDSDGHPRWIAGELIAWRAANRVGRRTRRRRREG